MAPDVTWLATAGNDATARVPDAATGANLATARVAGALAAIDISPTAPAIVTAGELGPYRFNVALSLADFDEPPL